MGLSDLLFPHEVYFKLENLLLGDVHFIAETTHRF